MSNDASTMSLETPTDRAEEDRASVFAARTEEDRALVLAAQSDTTAAGQVFDKYYPESFRWRRIPFRAWLYRIATNELRMHYRKQKRMSAANAGPVDPESPAPVPSADTVAAGLD